MITIKDFTKEMREEIAQTIGMCFKRFGINARINFQDYVLRNGETILRVWTDNFQTQPVLFDSVYISGDGYLSEYENDNGDKCGIYNLSFTFYYNYQTFTRGSNGGEFCKINFRLFEGNMRVAFIGLTL